MKIGIIGDHKRGQNLGLLLAQAGHEVLFGSSNPVSLGSFIKSIGNSVKVTATTIEDAFEEKVAVYILTVAFSEIDRLAELYAGEYSNTVIIDATNPDPLTDGDIAQKVLDSNQNASEYVALKFGTARIVKAFNTISSEDLASNTLKNSILAIPYAAQDHQSKEIVRSLIEDLGFEAVYIGDLSKTQMMDPNHRIHGKSLNRKELETLINL
ncbi:NAD(P)-binding domain-containing protein [Aquimarina sp. ERC-38]|uniref:NADPH-dependent F420 reductase n=1 Tax=Aquimarina sp. ERC-38 TaxID=2949996 RepID=UPI0022477803|nr:NAD(P)-binding domain-containing protein [Aquimarina sp. ERC-38]UZO82472.1 NAD(P)-binding domain-containing protein [Aquimarina sp. ERC-38]